MTQVDSSKTDCEKCTFYEVDGMKSTGRTEEEKRETGE